jgi:hypothetical protein
MAATRSAIGRLSTAEVCRRLAREVSRDAAAATLSNLCSHNVTGLGAAARVGAAMAEIGLAERSHLAEWGRSRAAAGDLPWLVRRLILETAPVVRLGFAAAEGVTSGGWDGTARSASATVQVPDGLSLWEISNRSSPEKKADEDYEKRKATPDGSPTNAATYLAVTSRPWPKRDAWAKRRSGEGRWREVRAYGLDDIHTWLDEAPVTHAWISERIGLHPFGLTTAQRWWQKWSTETAPPLSPAVVLAGRDSAANALRDEFGGGGQLLTIAAPSRDDVFSFVAAVAAHDANAADGALLARMVFVDRVETWRRLREHARPLVMVALTQEVIDAADGGSPHHIVVPVPGEDADLTLPPVDAQAAAAALTSAGLPEERAQEVGELARRSLLAGRRRIAVKRELHRPDWAKAPVERIARRVILLGRFNEGSDGDRTVVTKVLGVDFDAATEQLAGYAAVDDPLLAQLGSSFAVVSPFDAWLLVRGAIRRDDLEAFHQAAVTVLTEVDPQYELERAERWLAGVRGKTRVYSYDLRIGIATTLALLGAHGDTPVASTSLMAREWAGWIVRDVIAQASKDQTGHRWASLGDVLPLLAEAAPDEFVDAVRDGLTGDDPLLRKMFEDTDDVSALHASSAHSALLWALETCSWSPRHFGQVVELLARLDEVDPGGKLGNRPFGSLLSIFRPWFPQTSVSAERRLDTLEALRERHPGVAWKVMKALLLERHGFAMHMSGPRYRDWKPAEIAPTRAEYWAFIGELFKRVLDDAGADPERLTPLVDGLPNLPPDSRTALLTRIDEIAEDLDEDARVVIWSVMRAEAAKNREFAEAEWALPVPEVEQLEALTARLQPATATVRLRWLFDDHLPSIPGVQRGHGLNEYAPAVEDLRTQAAREVVAENDWDGIYRFAKEVKLPWFFGWVLADADVEHEPKLLTLLDSDDWGDFQLASSYFANRFRVRGWGWLDALLAQELAARQRARLLLVTGEYPTAWERADAAGTEVAQAFWREFPKHGHGPEFPHIKYVARRMIDVGRVGAALDLINLYLREETGGELAELVADGLELLLDRPDDPDLEHLSQYGLRTLFEYLERSEFDEGRLARLEWSYLPAFEFEPAPPTLSRHLASSPDFFVEAVRRIWRPREGDDADDAEGDEEVADDDVEPSAEEQAVATNAYRLLSEWRTLPGQDGTDVDGAVLDAWVDRARELLREEKRLTVGDLRIGHLLASSPPDPDGGWPCRAVRDVLERVQSRHVEDGMATEIFNSLGVTARGVLDGGEHERGRAERYQEQAERFYDSWPRTAAVLREAAESFERAARRHDAEAERRRTGLDR